MKEVRAEGQQGLLGQCAALRCGAGPAEGSSANRVLTALLKQLLGPLHQFYSLNLLFTEVSSHNPVIRDVGIPYRRIAHM